MEVWYLCVCLIKAKGAHTMGDANASPLLPWPPRCDHLPMRMAVQVVTQSCQRKSPLHSLETRDAVDEGEGHNLMLQVPSLLEK
jgi:hypothetical protein